MNRLCVNLTIVSRTYELLLLSESFKLLDFLVKPIPFIDSPRGGPRFMINSE